MMKKYDVTVIKNFMDEKSMKNLTKNPQNLLNKTAEVGKSSKK